MALLPLFQIPDATVMQWQNRWKSLLDPLLKGSNTPEAIVSRNDGVNLVQSLGCGSMSVAFSTTNAQITNLTVKFTPLKGPVLITLQPDLEKFPNDIAFSGVPALADSQCAGSLNLFRDGIQITSNFYATVATTAGAPFTYATNPAVSCLDKPALNVEHVYSLKISSDTSANSLSFFINNFVLVAQELGS